MNLFKTLNIARINSSLLHCGHSAISIESSRIPTLNTKKTAGEAYFPDRHPSAVRQRGSRQAGREPLSGASISPLSEDSSGAINQPTLSCRLFDRVQTTSEKFGNQKKMK